jgi:aryl-alcohol dehydrogenase-like predicted oxidoreductase
VPQTSSKGAESLRGHATVKGTSRFADRFENAFAPGFYRRLGAAGPRVSSLGLGTYLGECDDADDARYTTLVRTALERGINLLDTAINYRCQRSERAVGRALARAVDSGTVARDELVVCTKGGYIPLEGSPPATRADYEAMLEREYFAPGVLGPDDVVGGGHSLAPKYLEHQIDRSRANLGLGTIDVYYLHNPEQQLEVLDRAAFLSRMRDAFALLERKCADGAIVRYGCATWNGFRVAPDDKRHLSLAELVQLARDVAGDGHHCRVIQLPINLAMNEAVRARTQRVGSAERTILEAAAELDVSVIASASLLQGKLTRGLPSQLREALPGFDSDAQRAIAFVRSVPVVTTALVGMRSGRHLEENLGAGKA